jgi:hypothetical protein
VEVAEEVEVEVADKVAVEVAWLMLFNVFLLLFPPSHG